MIQPISTLKKMTVFICMLGLLVPAMGNASGFYMKIEGKTQGAFKSDRKGIRGIGYRHEIQSPRDAATGRAKGKRQHGAITIVKEWDAASPQIFQAMVTNEMLSEVTFEFFKSGRRGSEETYYVITLHNASVSKIEYRSGAENNTATKTQGNMELEHVSFTYQKITMQSISGSTMAEDDWRSR